MKTTNGTMIAASYTKYGPPEVVTIKTVPKPTISDEEILVKIHATTVNRTDCAYRSAYPFVNRLVAGITKPKAKILGCEFAGEVVAVGKDVSKYSIGDRVCGFDDVKFGGHAQYVAKNEDAMMTIIPSKYSYNQAAPLLESSHYALSGIRASNPQKGQHVLVHGASGGIGSATVQILKTMEVMVTATCNTKNIPTVKKLGADIIINYEKTDFTESKDRYDAVFDTVGKSSFGEARKVLKNKGIYNSSELGPRNENPFLALRSKIYGSQKVVFPIPKNLKEDADYLAQLATDGLFTPLIDREYDLEDIVAAATYVDAGEKVGNVVINVAHE